MFAPNHYVPVLRWKPAEMGALAKLSAHDRERITPLIEIIPKDFGREGRCPRDVTRKKAKQIWSSWGRTPVFVDLGLLPPTAAAPLTHLLSECSREMKLRLVPVAATTRPIQALAAIRTFHKEHDSGVCLRVNGSQLDVRSIDATLRRLAVSPAECDFIVDLKGDFANLVTLCGALPHLSDWRSFAVLQGAFPRDLIGMPVGRCSIPRSDWLNWRRYTTSAAGAHRLPTFGDYTIQCPQYDEPPAHANFSASIRYAAHDHWLIMRGEGVFNKKGPGFAQWPAHAMLLREDPDFCGAAFSFGDAYIEERAVHPDRTGSASTWLRAGINHHIVYVLRQLANLPAQVTPGE